MELLLFLAAFLTSLLSGTLAVGGGSALMFFLTLLLPVPETMLLHGSTQLTSNTTRTILFRKHIEWKNIFIYSIGSAIALSIFFYFSYVPEKYMIYLFLGFLPLLSLFKKIGKPLSFERYRNSAIAGGIVSFAQMSFGVSGSIIDMFFTQSSYDKYKTIANKSITQIAGHLFKIVFYFSIVFSDASTKLQLHWFPICIFGAWLGTFTGKKLVAYLKEEDFQKYTRLIITGLSCMMIYKGFTY